MPVESLMVIPVFDPKHREGEPLPGEGTDTGPPGAPALCPVDGGPETQRGGAGIQSSTPEPGRRATANQSSGVPLQPHPMPQPDPEQLPWPHPSSQLPARPSISRGRGAEAHPGGPGLRPVRHRHASPTCHPRAAGGLYPDHPTISKEGAHSTAPGDMRQPPLPPLPWAAPLLALPLTGIVPTAGLLWDFLWQVWGGEPAGQSWEGEWSWAPSALVPLLLGAVPGRQPTGAPYPTDR